MNNNSSSLSDCFCESRPFTLLYFDVILQELNLSCSLAALEKMTFKYSKEILGHTLIPQNILDYTYEDLMYSVDAPAPDLCQKQIARLTTIAEEALSKVEDARMQYHLQSHIYQNAVHQHAKAIYVLNWYRRQLANYGEFYDFYYKSTYLR
jgi:hypothetical protein